jgi:hypothetical protein
MLYPLELRAHARTAADIGSAATFIIANSGAQAVFSADLKDESLVLDVAESF